MAIIEKQTAFIDEKRGGTIVTKIPKEHAEAFTELRDWCEKWKVCLFSSDENRMTRLYVNFLGNDLNSYYQVYYNIPLPSLNILRVDREHLDVRKPIPWNPDKEGPPKALREWTEWKKKSSEEEK